MRLHRLFVALSLVGCQTAPNASGDAGTMDASSGSSGATPTTGLGEPGEPVTLHGAVQKGPFVLGTSVSVSPLTDTGEPKGQQFEVPTSNSVGEFSVNGVPPGPVALLASGYHFDEIRGGSSIAPLTLRALHRVSDDATTVNVHVLGHLGEARARRLVAVAVAVEDALAVAEAETVAALGVGKAGFTLAGPAAEASLIGPDTDDNAYLFALSAVVMQAAHLARPDAADAALHMVAHQLAADRGDDGEIDEALRTRLAAAETALAAKDVRAGLGAYLAGLGLVMEPPDLERILDQDHDGLANSDDNCPLVVNAAQENADGDDRGDACDACPNSGSDMDADGYDDAWDNCPSVANDWPPQDAMPPLGKLSDTDQDGLGDACDSCPRSKDRGADPDDVCCDPRSSVCVKDPGSTLFWQCLVEGDSFDCETVGYSSCAYYSDCLGCYSKVCAPEGAVRPKPNCAPESSCDCSVHGCITPWCTVGSDECEHGNTCIPWFHPGEAPEPGMENLGICADAEAGPCVGKVGSECT